MAKYDEEEMAAAEAAVPAGWVSDIGLAEHYDVSRHTIWRWVRTVEAFPKPVKLSPGITRWRLDAIRQYDDAAVAA